MAELADAADSKSADLRVLGVRLPLPAPGFEQAGTSSACAPRGHPLQLLQLDGLGIARIA
jgi:hypothetical protein